MSNRVLIFGDGGKAKELARMIASGDTQAIMPIEQHDEQIRADEVRKFAEWLINSKYLGICNDGFMYDVSDSNFKCKISSIDEVLAEYELGQVKKEIEENKNE